MSHPTRHMKYLVGIPYVNRLDLLYRALLSLGWLRKNALILNNSGADLEVGMDLIVQWPTVPLSFSQSMNFFQRIAKHDDILIIMHSDAEAVGDTAQRLLDLAWLQAGKWGVLFTNYDALAAFNMKAVAEVGEWDTNLPQYFSDNDYYRRMRLAGWECRDTGLPVKHEASSTIKADPKLAFINRVTFNLYREYYRAKWGGLDDEPGQWTKPWNGALEHCELVKP